MSYTGHKNTGFQCYNSKLWSNFTKFYTRHSFLTCHQYAKWHKIEPVSKTYVKMPMKISYRIIIILIWSQWPTGLSVTNKNHQPYKVPMALNIIPESSKIKLKLDAILKLPLTLHQSVSTLLCRYQLLSSACRAFVTVYYTLQHHANLSGDA